MTRSPKGMTTHLLTRALSRLALVGLLMLATLGVQAQNDVPKEPDPALTTPDPKEGGVVVLTAEQEKMQALLLEQTGQGNGTPTDPLHGGVVNGRPPQQAEPLNENPTAQPQ